MLGLGGTAYASTEADDAVVDRVRAGLRAQSYRGGIRPAVRSQGPARRVSSSSTPRALLRSAFKDRIEALARAVQGGIFSPNEAREREGLRRGRARRRAARAAAGRAAVGSRRDPGDAAAGGAPPAGGALAPKVDGPPKPDAPPKPTAKDFDDVVASQVRTIFAMPTHMTEATLEALRSRSVRSFRNSERTGTASASCTRRSAARPSRSCRPSWSICRRR